ncbi:MAG: hypothetical protein HYS83_02685 [Candidatus Blackburnbacteria bacterium]|nr:hypothetical protein [Candidatus Blackburnbacteria bacterium]
MARIICSLHLIIFSIVFYFLFSIFYFPAFAQQEFTVSYNTTYILTNDGAADVVQEITLTNNFSTVYATSYSLILEGKTPKSIEAVEDNRSLPIETNEEGGKLKITVNFPNAVVGKNKSRALSIKYSLPKVAIQNGQVWDLTIPKLASPETINDYKLTLLVPTAFGNPAYISPRPKSQEARQEFQEFIFEKDSLAKAGVVAAFGQAQIFSLSLVYHLQNPYSKMGETEIAIPPDTAYQRVYYENLNPKPAKIRVDEDGNWLAVYRLKGKEELDVFLEGKVQVFAEPQEFYPKISPKNQARYLSEAQYWEVNDPEIREIAKTLKTPRAIYDFVVGKLNYDYSRVREGTERLGAKMALNDPDRAICMEFTDLFVALARAAGIPAREINGYAYTENPEIQPLSLVADVLHAWPEYWDEENSVWRPVDPTWGKTTGGVDFFDKFDLNHIVFAIHGQDSNFPLPAGSYKASGSPEKDVKVSFSQLPQPRIAKPSVSVDFSSPAIPLRPSSLNITVYNSGPTALYNQKINIKINGLETGEIPKILDFLPPFGSQIISVPVKTPFFLAKTGELVQIGVGEENVMYNISLERVRLSWILVGFGFLLLLVIGILSAIKAKTLFRVARRLWPPPRLGKR